MLTLAHVLSGVQRNTMRHMPHISSQWRQVCFSEVVTDSRLVKEDTLFVALKGERTDGHLFLVDVAQRGAKGALVQFDEIAQVHARLEQLERPWQIVDLSMNCQQEQWAEAPDSRVFLLIVVDDTLKALQQFARYHRLQCPVTVVGITGSVGKTSVKDVTAALLSRRYCTLKSKKSYNSEVTVPTTLLDLTADHEVAVVELGMWAPGEIRQLAHLAQPHIGVVTNVGPSHLERMGSMESIANAKAELVEALPADGIAILNADDTYVSAMACRTPARVFTYGYDSSADLWVDHVQSHGLAGVSFCAHYCGEKIPMHVPLPGRHQVYTILAATAVSLVMGLSWDNIQCGLQEQSIQTRLLIVPATIRGERYTIIDDSYNASPISAQAAIHVLADCQGRRIVVMGDMLELGSFEQEGHRIVGRSLAGVADYLIGVGPRARWIAEEAHACGMAQDHIFLVEQRDHVVPILQGLLQSGDYVLVKGSRSMAMEQIVVTLTSEVQ